MGRPESNTTTIPETSHENLMKILKMSRPESNTTKIPYIKIYKNPKKSHENPKTWGKVARAQICFFPLNRAYINRILHFLSSITFSKNFKLTIKNINYLLNRRPYIPTQHTVPQAHYFFQAQHHCNIFRQLHPQTDGLVFTIGGPAPLVRLWVPGLPKQIPQVSKRNSLELPRD